LGTAEAGLISTVCRSGQRFLHSAEVGNKGREARLSIKAAFYKYQRKQRNGKTQAQFRNPRWPSSTHSLE
jgi:hypothetical protein